MTSYPRPPDDLVFRKSPESDDQNGCVELAPDPAGGMWLRDSKDTSKAPFFFTPHEWAIFDRWMKNGLS